MSALGPDGKRRCAWSLSAPDFLAYHDEEWGFPVGDDTRLFEKLSLEAFQSGLSWRTILAKRESFRAAFRGFDFVAVAKFTARDVERLLRDEGIVRHRGKIEAVVRNAKAARAIVAEDGSFGALVWRYEGDARRRAASPSPEAIALAKELKRRGFGFVGPTTVYAFMQAKGLVNDHEEDCFVRARGARARRSFRPTSAGPSP